MGDDDVWVFINGTMAVEMPGTHNRAVANVNIDAANGTAQVAYPNNSTLNTKTKAAAAKTYATPGNYDVFATATDGKVRAWDIGTGEPRWQYDAGHPFFAGAAIAGVGALTGASIFLLEPSSKFSVMATLSPSFFRHSTMALSSVI